MKKSKKFLSLLLAIITLFSVSIVTVTPVSAATYPNSNSGFSTSSSPLSLGAGEHVSTNLYLKSQVVSYLKKHSTPIYCYTETQKHNVLPIHTSFRINNKDVASKRYVKIQVYGQRSGLDLIGMGLAPKLSMLDPVYQLVKVYNAPKSVKLNYTYLAIPKGRSTTISETTDKGSYANNQNLKWLSSNTKVATVTKGSGNKATIKAVRKGTAYITIRTYNGKTAKCKVVVR